MLLSLYGTALLTNIPVPVCFLQKRSAGKKLRNKNEFRYGVPENNGPFRAMISNNNSNNVRSSIRNIGCLQAFSAPSDKPEITPAVISTKMKN
jgi:hypothetical protein